MYRNSQRRFKMGSRTQYGRVYDSLRQPVGSIMNGRVLDVNGHYVGCAINDRIYDAHGSRVGWVVSSHLYNAQGVRVGHIASDGFTYDQNGQEVGQVTLTFRDRILGGAVALLLLFKNENQAIKLNYQGNQ